MLIAFASSDGITIDSHFAAASAFKLYQFTGEEKGVFHSALVVEQSDESIHRLNARIDMLKGCVIVYCTQIGGPAAARLVQSGIHPLKVAKGTFIDDELSRLNKLLLSDKLPPWLKKKMGEEA